ncbi:MAG: 2-C-methyl-D-erythritol 4-phosphate cytidylyltransferase [Fuerstiella sp.]
MSEFAVIIPAAGASSRFSGFRKKKPFVDLKGRAIWLRTVEHFVNRDDVTEVVLVLAEEDLNDFREQFRPNLAFMDILIAKGGASRAESVRNGMRALTKPSDFIAVHDAARPLLTKTWISQIFEAARQKHAVIPGVPVSSTVKKVNAEGAITGTVDRNQLMLAQTPQVFRRRILEQAYQAAPDPSVFTDESSLVEASGQTVFVHAGWPMNIKITTPQDFELAEAFIGALPVEGGLPDLRPFGHERFR